MKKKLKKVFDDYSNYYDLLYSDKNYPKESKYINKLLEKSGLKKCDILEFGSGTGGHASILTKKYNHKILGIDLSEKMVAKALQNPNFKSIVGDMRTFNAKKQFQCVLALFHVVSYLQNASDIKKFFDNANRHLLPGGKLIFDCWYSPCVNFVKPSTTIKKMENNSCEVFRIGEPRSIKSENQVEVNFTTFIKNKSSKTWSQLKESHLMKHFSKEDIKLIAKSSGFRITSTEEFMTGNKASKSTWGVCFVLKKVPS